MSSTASTMDIQDILIAAGSIGNADIRPDDTAWVVSGDIKLCFGPAHTESGDPAEGWDATEYWFGQDRGDDCAPYWHEGNYTYAQTDGEMITLAAKYA